MTEAELIARQQLDLENCKQLAESNLEIKRQIIGKFYNIGQPLNDNILQLNPKQQKWAWDVVKLVEQLEFEI